MSLAKRRWRVLTVCAVAVCILVGCAGNDGRTAPTSQSGVADVLQEQSGAAIEETSQEAEGFTADDAPAFSEVDFDLTTMGSQMVYATVYDMMLNPQSYVGKTVRVDGPYYHTHYDPTNRGHFYVIIQDATACCSQGLEFVWGDGNHNWPHDYPADGREVVVTGRFEVYREGQSDYAHLVDASLEVADHV